MSALHDSISSLIIYMNSINSGSVTCFVLQGEEYFFGSFLDRDQCFNMLTVMVKIAKGLVEMEFYSEHGHGHGLGRETISSPGSGAPLLVLL